MRLRLRRVRVRLRGRGKIIETGKWRNGETGKGNPPYPPLIKGGKRTPSLKKRGMEEIWVSILAES